MNLRDAKVVGFFSLPSRSLAESNPTAFNQAWAAAPHGAGTCANCGTGILHHVVVEVDGARKFIGTDCAQKVGTDHIRECVRQSKTSEQLAKITERQNEVRLQFEAQRAAEAARCAKYVDILTALEAQRSEFHTSLAQQLKYGPLSGRQAHFVATAMLGRLSKKNGEQWDEILTRCQS